MGDLIFLNFFVVSILIGGVFYLLVALFIFGAIPDKSRATLHLGYSFLTSSILALAYVPAYAIYDPGAAFHRWLTVPAALLTHPHYAQVFYHFPDTRRPRLARAILIIQYVVAIGLIALFYAKTYGAGRVYSFEGHFWDFDADALSKLVAAAIIVNILHLLVIGVISIIRRPGQRLVLFGILAGMLFAVLIPSVTNALSRDGLISREFHQTTLVLMSVTGLFITLIVYLNNTRERTTFMVKIVGVCLVVFMVVLVFVSYFTLQDRELSYDAVRREQTARVILERDFAPPDLVYTAAFDLSSGKAAVSRGSDAAAGVPFRALEDEYRNTALYESVRVLRGPEWKDRLRELVSIETGFARGHAATLLKEAQAAPNAAALLTVIDGMERTLLYRSNKIRDLADRDFRARLIAYCASLPAPLRAYGEAIKVFVEQHPQLEGAALKREVRRFLTPLRPAGSRHYRTTTPDGRHLTAFLQYDPRQRVVHEAGFSYLHYRHLIHDAGQRLTLIFLAVVLTVAVGFRIFFLGTLVRPLEALLTGVRQVNAGRLDVSVPESSSDEIGFLSTSFNGMVDSIREARQELQQYANGLEDKVRERTAELQATLNRVQELKDQQDGDYFLTSLLIKPLTGNRARSATVQVDFLIEQKKKFSFRKWQEEIGGDFCNARSVTLQDRACTVFVNADAMGKSIQGAGGALVLGAVFESLLERTRSITSLKEQSPERWIKNAFQELQGVFESFDGSMLVSMALGVIDDETGLLYYINVEHPWSVLYRNGQASFIEEGQMFRKLGITGLEGRVSVLTFQMEPDDVLIVGSDGRDDLLLGRTQTGERTINEDEHLFRGIVEAGKGNLEDIYTRLLDAGELTDDLSLIRISYRAKAADQAARPQEQIGRHRTEALEALRRQDATAARAAVEAALALDDRDLQTLRLGARVCLLQRDFARAFALVEDYVWLRPADTEMLYLAAYLCKRLRRFPEAIEFGERVRLRSPDFLRNLLTLAEVYAAVGNFERASKILDQARAVDGDSAREHRLREAVNRLAEKKSTKQK